MRQVAHIVGRSLESGLPSLSASEGEIPRRDATLTASATGESRFRFESGALRPKEVQTATGCQQLAGASPLHYTEPAARRASFFLSYPNTVTAMR